VLVAARIYDEIDWFAFFILLLPLYVLTHFVIANKIGYNESHIKNQNFFKISSILSILVFICIPLTLLFIDRKEKKELCSRIEKLKQPLDLGKDTTVFNIECNLRTRYTDKNLEYIFHAEYIGSDKPKVKAFEISLLDSSGFKVDAITIDSWTNRMDSESKEHIGFSQKGKKTLYDYTQYERIKTFDVGVRLLNK
jgi:hypothetical protein